MSRLDRHVSFVQNKLALSRFLAGLAWAALIYAAIIWGAIAIDRVVHVRPPLAYWWFLGGVGLTILVAIIYGIIKRPSAQVAASAIDERLGLKEKFSTALYVR